MFQWRVLTGDYVGDLGLALSHPLYIAMGRLLLLIPISQFPARLNFLSGLGMALALANLAVVGAVLTRRRWIGLSISGMLGVSHTVWWLSTIAEVYTWSVAGLSIEVWLVITLLRFPKWYKLAALGLVNGLGLCLHNLALLPLPIYMTVAVVFVVHRYLPPWSLVVGAGAYLLGGALFFSMIVNFAINQGDFFSAVQSAVFSKYMPALFGTSFNWPQLKVNAALAGLNFVNILGPLEVIGLIHFRRRLGRPFSAVLGAVIFVQCIFVILYRVPDQFTFLLGVLWLLAIPAAIGLSVIVDISQKWQGLAITGCLFSILFTTTFYSKLPSLIRGTNLEIKRGRELPFRDEIRYWLVPWKNTERSAELFAAAALKEAEPNGVILPDSTSVHPLLLVQKLYGHSPKVAIQHGGHPLPPYGRGRKTFLDILGNRPLFLVAPIPGYAPETLLADVEINNEGVLYRVSFQSPRMR